MKSFELVYYEKEYRTLALERRFKKLLNFEIEHQKEIVLEAIAQDDGSAADDIVDRLASLFWRLKMDEECLLFKVKTRAVFGKIDEQSISNEIQLAELMRRYKDKSFILVYLNNSHETKVVMSSSILFQTIYLMNEDNIIDEILSLAARKTGIRTKEDGNKAEQFLKEHLIEGMTISEIVDVYEKMLNLEIDGTEELYHFEVDECEFDHLKFCLTRQFPTFYDDEFYMITLIVTTPITEKFEQYYEGFDWDGIGNSKRTDFINQIRETALYKDLDCSGIKMIDYEVCFEES